MPYNLHTAFGRAPIEALTAVEVTALARDIRAIMRDEPDEHPTGDDACRTLRERIGGPANLKPYVACLLAGKHVGKAESFAARPHLKV
jgi:hypothetical protein